MNENRFYVDVTVGTSGFQYVSFDISAISEKFDNFLAWLDDMELTAKADICYLYVRKGEQEAEGFFNPVYVNDSDLMNLLDRVQ